MCDLSYKGRGEQHVGGEWRAPAGKERGKVDMPVVENCGIVFWEMDNRRSVKLRRACLGAGAVGTF